MVIFFLLVKILESVCVFNVKTILLCSNLPMQLSSLTGLYFIILHFIKKAEVVTFILFLAGNIKRIAVGCTGQVYYVLFNS